MKTITRIVILFFIVLLAACNLPEQEIATSAPVTSPSGGKTPQPPTAIPSSGPAEHLIAVRALYGNGEFYNRQTGQKFVPRGMNYVRLGSQTKTDGTSTFGHSLFDPGKYNSEKVDSDLTKMQAEGYNVVRVFLSPDTIGTANGGLSSAAMDNVADFLQRAKQHKIYVMFTLDWLPGGKYGSILSADCCTTFALNNANLLPPAGLKANQAFFKDFAQGLIERGAPTEYIFSYQLRNEMYYDGDQPPLSLKSGKVTTANGKTYNMASADEKAKMLEENSVYWIDSVREAILEVDPTALVSVGFFHPQEPNPSRIGDPRLAVTEPAIWTSKADFIDLHAYPGFELSLKQYVENFGLNSMKTKPIIMGEFGGLVASFPSVDAAAHRFVNWQAESCKYGFDGWLFWTWDTFEQGDFLNAKMDGGNIEAALSPAQRSDPCAAGAGGETNLAAGKQVKSSAFLPDQPPSNAVDNAPETIWSSGAGSVQWIEIDLGKPSTITAIRLTVSQYPAGGTTHQVWVRGPTGSLEMVHSFKGNTTDGQILEFTPGSPLEGIQVIRIVTTSSPSWVAWREIEVMGK
jgi:hypothetical protein